MLCRSQWLHGATGCARAIISLRSPISSFRQRVHSRRGRAGSSHATHWQRQCSQLHTRWPTTSTRQRSTPGGALTLDGGSAWAWGRSGWIHAYRGKSVDAIERFQIARNLAPSDPLIFLAAVGIAAAHFEAYRYEGCSLVSACSRRAAQGRLDQSISHSGLCPRGAEGRGETEPLHTHFGVSIAHHIPNSDRLASQRQLSRQRVQRP
jgi:hypothetical protein